MQFQTDTVLTSLKPFATRKYNGHYFSGSWKDFARADLTGLQNSPENFAHNRDCLIAASWFAYSLEQSGSIENWLHVWESLLCNPEVPQLSAVGTKKIFRYVIAFWEKGPQLKEIISSKDSTWKKYVSCM